jgi:hypothetical protein
MVTPKAPYAATPYESRYNRLVALLLCLFVGYLGIHGFYVGKIGTGVLWMLSGGMFWDRRTHRSDHDLHR